MAYWLRNKSYFWRKRITLDKVPKDKRNERFWVISNYDNSPVQYICTLTRARRIIVFCWVGHLFFLLLIITVIITIIYNSIYAIIITILYITLLYNTILLLLERCLQSSTPLPGSSSQRSSTAASLATDRLLLIALVTFVLTTSCAWLCVQFYLRWNLSQASRPVFGPWVKSSRINAKNPFSCIWVDYCTKTEKIIENKWVRHPPISIFGQKCRDIRVFLR